MTRFANAGVSQVSRLRNHAIAAVLALQGVAVTAEASPLRYTFSYAPSTLAAGDSGYANQVLNPVSFSFALNSTPEDTGGALLQPAIWLDVVSRTATGSVILDNVQAAATGDWEFRSTMYLNFLNFDSGGGSTPVDPGVYTFGSVEGSTSQGPSSFRFIGTGALTIEELSTPIPEPATGALALLALAGLGLAATRARRRQVD